MASLMDTHLQLMVCYDNQIAPPPTTTTTTTTSLLPASTAATGSVVKCANTHRAIVAHLLLSLYTRMNQYA